MRRPRPKILFIPLVGLLTAALVLLFIVGVTTYFNLDRIGRQDLRVLEAHASTVVSGVIAGLRTGWRHWGWRPDSLHSLLVEMSGGDVAFIILLDGKSRVVAHSDETSARPAEDYIAALGGLNKEETSARFTPDKSLYIYGRRVRPEEMSNRGIGPGPWMGMGPGMGMGRWEQNGEAQELRPEYILVGLDAADYIQTKKSQIQNALIMAGLLFVLGSAAIYLIFVVQNYRTIDRTLSDLSTYTSSIVDNMPNGLITLDSKGEPVMVNRAARRMFGWGNKSERELTNESVLVDLVKRFGERLGRGETVLEEEFRAAGAEGRQLPLAVSATSVSTESESQSAGTIFIMRDLTQIKSLEEQVSRSERLAAVGRLAAGVAHEVRNPLSSMRGLARFLARGMKEDSREAQYLKVMVEEIDRLNRVITGLLDFARPKPPELAAVDLNDTARHTMNLVSDDAAHSGISVRSDYDPTGPAIRADRDQTVQAMLNVLLNAVEAMPDGGRLTVTTRQENGWGLFLVEDTGPGLPAEDRSRLVDPFFTTKKKGTGLGLAQVAKIMEAHGGKLDLGGEPGLGARVALVFPIAPKVAEPAEEEA